MPNRLTEAQKSYINTSDGGTCEACNTPNRDCLTGMFLSGTVCCPACHARNTHKETLLREEEETSVSKPKPKPKPVSHEVNEWRHILGEFPRLYTWSGDHPQDGIRALLAMLEKDPAYNKGGMFACPMITLTTDFHGDDEHPVEMKVFIH